MLCFLCVRIDIHNNRYLGTVFKLLSQDFIFMDIVNTLDLKTLNLQIMSPSHGTSCRDLSICENKKENYNRSDDSQHNI